MEVIQLPLVAELTLLGFVVDTVSTAEGARRKFRFPGYHDLVLVDGEGCRDGSAVAIAQDLRGLESEHRLALAGSGEGAKGGPTGKRAATVQALVTVVCGLCSTPELRSSLSAAPAAPQIASGYGQRPAEETLLAFDMVLRYPLRIHTDSLMATFCSREGDVAPAVQAPDHPELLREVMRVAGHRFPLALQQKIRAQLPATEQFSLATAEAAALQSRIRSLEGEVAAAKSAAAQAEMETDVANTNARRLRDEVNDAVERRIEAEAILEGMSSELSEARRVRAAAAVEFEEFRRGVAARARADAHSSVEAAATKLSEAAARAQGSPKRGRKHSPKSKRKGSPRKSPAAVPETCVDALVAAAASEAAQAADEHAKSMRFLCDELDRSRAQQSEMHTRVAQLESECGVLRLRFLRLKQFVVQSGLPDVPSSGGPEPGSTLQFPRRGSELEPSPSLGTTGRRLSVSAHGDDDDGSRRQALREARMHRHAIRRQSISVVDRSHVSRDKVRLTRSAMLLRLEAAEANAMALADAASTAAEVGRSLGRDGVGREIKQERARLHKDIIDGEARVAQALSVLPSKLAARTAEELTAMPEVSRAILMSADHSGFIDGVLSPLQAYEGQCAKERGRLVRDLSVALHNVTSDPRRFVALAHSEEARSAVAAAVLQLNSRLDLVLERWVAAAAFSHEKSVESLLCRLKETVRAIDACVVPLQGERYFSRHKAPAETQTEAAFTIVDAEGIAATVDSDVRGWLAQDAGEYAKAAAVAASMGFLTANRSVSPMPRGNSMIGSRSASNVGSPQQISGFPGAAAFKAFEVAQDDSRTPSPAPPAPTIAFNAFGGEEV